MDQSAKNRTKKYLCLLKQAQNEAFAALVVDNLKVELQSKPYKLLTVLEFIVSELSVSHSDFTRLKICETLIPAICQVAHRSSEKFQQSIEAKMNQEDVKLKMKAQEKVRKSIVSLNVEDPLQIEEVHRQQLSFLNFTKIAQNRNFFSNLIQNYQPLSRQEGLMEVDQTNSMDKEKQKQFMVEFITGQKIETIKLSDLMDEDFLNNIGDGDLSSARLKEADKLPIQDLVQELAEESKDSVFEIPQTNKRQKTVKDTNHLKLLMMGPQLALTLYATKTLLSTDWKQRQFSAVLLNTLLQTNHLNFDYFPLSQDQKTKQFSFSLKCTVPKDKILKNPFPRLLILLIKDSFNDFEEQRMLTPVREEGLKLFATLQTYKELFDDYKALLTQLPVILKAVEDDVWNTRFNFFLILKGLLHSHREQVFNMFGKILITSLLHVEDETRIVVAELIESLLPLYLQKDNKYQILSELLKNLKENLQKTDEIECSAVSVFNLILKVLESVDDLDQLEFKMDLNTLCPFNFHKVEQVRYFYHKIVNKCLQSFAVSVEDLHALLTLVLQSLVMESYRPIVKMLYANLKLLVAKYQTFAPAYLNLLQSQTVTHMMEWLHVYQIESFDQFVFFESKAFESINGDYYKVVQKPVTYQECDDFYYKKTKSLTKAIAILMTHFHEASQLVISSFQSQFNVDAPYPVFETHFYYLLTINHYLKLKPTDLQPEFVAALNESTLWYLQNLSIECVSSLFIPEVNQLQLYFNILFQKVEQYQLQDCMEPLSYFGQLLDNCHQAQRLENINEIQAQCNILVACFAQYEQQRDVTECFNSFTSALSSIFHQGQNLVNRIQCVSSMIQIQSTLLGLTQLTNQLNCLIKPLLAGTKLAKIRFMQKLNAKYLVQLLEILQKQNKTKIAQCVMTEIAKKFEQVCQDPTQDLGTADILKYIADGNENIFSAYKNFMGDYFLSKQLTPESAQNWMRAVHFILDNLNKQKMKQPQSYRKEGELIQNHISHIMSLNQDFSDLSKLFVLAFTMFPHSQVALVSTLVKQMDHKSRVAFDCLKTLLESQNNDIMKFIPVFIIPVIKNIQYSRQIFNDDKQVTLILSKLLQLLPLNLTSINDIAEGKQSGDLQALAEEGYNFLQVFCSNQMVTEYKLSIKVKAQLRDYQRQGITWLASLGKFNLNSALCDDMGLGKTIQSLCVILNESFLRRKQTNIRPTNLIICPTSITHNWQYEIEKFFDGFRAIVYEGATANKSKILKDANHYDVIIASYDNVRSDAKAFKNLQFFYVVLDEAHIIKNSKAKRTLAVKSLTCEKKLILTGTPLQNRVSELWSIFDFLLPGFLEEENIFNKKYNQYLSTNIKKLSEKLEDTQSFLDALKSLKKRISPFILRRTKQDVLKELPPKIIQDYPCKMTKFQEYVHGLVDKQYPVAQVIQQEQAKTDTKKSNSILQHLILHRQVCNHPTFVTDKFPKDQSISNHLGNKNQTDYKLSGKLVGLVDLLIECDIIDSPDEKEESKSQAINYSQAAEVQSGSLLVDMALQSTSNASGVSKHRVLIFCQMKSYMDLIRKEILDQFKIKYLQLLSSHSSKERVDICNKFNLDDSIQVLLLTTSVGGLGLNLTGADTVIFAEHDWNPMKDLQAIDRAHRLGQTKTVNVYRLIVTNTLEEKIMSLQRFKQNLAKSLVQSKGVGTEDASSLEMSELLKSFEEHSTYQNNMKQVSQVPDKIVSGLEEIWQSDKFEEM